MYKGIRVVFTDGEFEDYDPVGEYERTEDYLIINGGQWMHSDITVDKVYEYELMDEKIDGIYVRLFENRDALRYKADQLKLLNVPPVPKGLDDE